MPLQTYQSLKERGSQDSLSASSSTTSMMRRANTSSSGVASASCLNLSALTLNDTNRHHPSGTQLHSYGSHQHQDAGMQHQQQHHHHHHQGSVGLQRGWGSVETRRASTSLSTMAEPAQALHHANHSRWPRPAVEANSSGDKDGWGYFVDTTADEDEDVLMW